MTNDEIDRPRPASNGMQCPRAAVFDLDETLAESFQPPKPEMIARLERLRSLVPVAIMTGAGFSRIDEHVLSQLHAPFERLYLFPNSSAQCFVFRTGAWHEEYNLALTEDERSRIKAAILTIVHEMQVLKDAPVYGDQIVDREAQIAFTITGLNAPQDVKKGWDPDGSKRKGVVEALYAKIPEFDILIGGASTIDITRKGVNKAYGVQWLSEELGLEPHEMFYTGDALYEGGNDRVVIPTGIQTRQVSGPDETLQVIDELLVACTAE